jgi:hypothetical protein
MIALCREHADQADSGAFRDEQLRTLKAGGARRDAVRGRFNWMRQEVLVRAGGNFYYRTPVIFELGAMPCVWLSWDDENNLLLNFRMPTLSGRPRASIEENFWTLPADVDEMICPPSGRLVEVMYRNGDRFRAEFLQVSNAAGLAARYPRGGVSSWASKLEFPLTLAEVWETAAGTTLEFGPNSSRIGGIVMQENFASDCGVGIHVGIPDEQLRRLFPSDLTPRDRST